MAVKDVAAYIAAAPKTAQPKLKQLRTTIRTAIPKAEEYISYGMPFYRCNDARVGFAAFTKHIGLFGVASVIDEYKRELADYTVTAKGAIHLPLDKSLPAALVARLVKARTRKRKA